MFVYKNFSKPRSIFSLSGFNYLDSNSKYDPFVEDVGQFEDLSQIKKAFCWKYCLLDKTNRKVKCKVQISEGNFCDRIMSYKASNIYRHLKHHHGIDKE